MVDKMKEVPYPGVVPWLAVRKKINEIIDQGGGGGGSVDWDDVQNKPTFSEVATSGDYDDLTNKPVIPDGDDFGIGIASTNGSGVGYKSRIVSLYNESIEPLGQDQESAKYYTAEGQNEDGSMTQKAITDALGGKAGIITGTAAPTTSTQAVVGDFYLNTTDGKLYQLKDDSSSTYVWEEVGGGGSTPTFILYREFTENNITTSDWLLRDGIYQATVYATYPTDCIVGPVDICQYGSYNLSVDAILNGLTAMIQTGAVTGTRVSITVFAKTQPNFNITIRTIGYHYRISV